MDRRLRRIAAKLAIAPHLPGRSHSFGEEQHRFRLGPPLTAAAVRRFETEHQIALPRGYRDFLMMLGHGGAGPYYGLLPLGSWRYSVRGDLPSGHLARPFPLSPGTSPGPQWWRHVGTPDEPFTGAIPLVHQGCTYASLLVVTGSARGRVVDIDLDLQPPFFPGDADFLDWYERWLTEIIDGVDSTEWGFSTSLPGTQAQLTAVLHDHLDPLQRARAAQTLGRHPGLTPPARAALVHAVHVDDDPQVRSKALWALTNPLLDRDRPVVEHALDDIDPKVRALAVRRLDRRGEHWHPRIRQALRDLDAEVRQAAIAALRHSELLTESDVLPLLDDPSGPVRADAIVTLSALGSPHFAAAARAALDDPHGAVRYCGLTRLRRARLLTSEDLAKVIDDPDPCIRDHAKRFQGSTPPVRLHSE
ncbi:HEAT repeat domain-containing protein [Actinoallomurus sp. NPDC050550]|uniref:HEAT repeat domain-containing protein n=1 Tax=Actinoallomurus sp. NPDC050550 TaxID=3154937 RepID=UPI0033F89AFA